ncbi:trypsin-like peptidase domain-containing protein [Streptomyces sp. MST-110588]|uniref:trypsin-like peptidase domain-containing protein n=1 Tax=Streptomyces sp. MST-110588 TaxID=2833628 RepID=UPI001F5E14C0|nr:trypsin-like peptidase domain-containing protein [Streptomyces sp. MST-110588]UNO40069.1 trypsin-like peptidase domain-containing protein [Streptomyces sp. MST-110588]
MDEGKAAGPKLNWWSRPGHPPAGHPSTEAAGPAAEAGGSPAASAAADRTGGPASEARQGGQAGQGRSGGAGASAPAADQTEVRASAAGQGGGADTGQTPGGASPEAAAESGVETGAGAGDRTEVPSGGAAAGQPVDSGRPRPLHPEDPYGTPPYGEPGPWAPAPPVQRPVATPAHGTHMPPAASHPPYGAPAAPPGAPVAPAPELPHQGGSADTGPAEAFAAQEGAPVHDDTFGTGGGPAAAGARTAESAGRAAGDPVPAPQGPAQQGPAPQGPVLEGQDATGAGTGRPDLTKHHAEPHPAPAPGAPFPQPQPHGHWQQYDPWSAPPQHPVPGLVPPAGPASRPRRGLLTIGAVVLALLAGGVGGGIGAYIERNGGISDIKLPQDAGDKGGRDPNSVAGIAQAALPGVVTLHVRGNSEQGTGTGFVLDKQGHILTNNHVVEPAGTGGEISVTFSGGETAKAKVIGRDGGYDLAVVKVEGVTGLRPLALGNSDSVRVGDPVVAIGAPYDLANTVTSGIISAKQRPITAGGKKGDGSDVSYVDALQTDAPINPGNSGGPLVDARARVIGINSAIRAADSGGGLEGGGQGGSIGLGFAIPINQGKWVAEELINKGRAMHPVIGVTLEMEYAGDGARVSSKGKTGGAPIVPGGPGAKAGIKPRDVITKVDGQPVHSGEELIVKIRSHRPGDRLTLTIRRDGKEHTAVLILGSSSQE